MRILYVHSLMFNSITWAKVQDRLLDNGLELTVLAQTELDRIKTELGSGRVDLLIAELARGLTGFKEILDLGQGVDHRIALNDEVPTGWGTLSRADEALFRAYLAQICQDNFLNGIKFAAAKAGLDLTYEPIQQVQTEGIFHPAAERTFADLETYLAWLAGERGLDPAAPLIGLVCYHGQIAENNTAEIDALILALEEHGFRPLAVYCQGPAESRAAADRGPAWFDYFRQPGRRPAALLNLLAARFLSRPGEIELLEQLDRPVFQLLRIHHQTGAEWLADPTGLGATGLVYGLAQPEMSGVIEPTVVAARQPDCPDLRYAPIAERIDYLCRRLKRWTVLAAKPNPEKRITVVLHNAPCQGVEATIGTAEGLNAFDSLADLLRAMDRAGYDLGGPPPDGAEIKAMILDRKAISEFRWTTPDEIVAKGGVLHYTDRAEYQTYLARLPEPVRKKVIDDWGEFPGEAMVYGPEGEEKLLITGLELGRIKIMVQPKRGCYGAKCTGEVCRILHDPLISPPHHWLATYDFINQTSDAVIHFGFEGALEYLPGKSAGLSENCFPDISLGELPNLYVYIMNVVGEGLSTKRRGRAVLVDHLAPAYRPTDLDDDLARAEDLLDQYHRAKEMDEPVRADRLAEELDPLLAELGLVADRLGNDRATIMDAAARMLARTRRILTPTKLHRLGRAPDGAETAITLASLLRIDSPDRPGLAEAAERGPAKGQVYDRALETVRAAIDDDPAAWEARWPGRAGETFRRWCGDIADRLRLADREIAVLLHGLDGGFIRPGPSGSLLLGQTNALPSGRNFYGLDITRLPTKAAFDRGVDLADQLLDKYLTEEGRFPKSVGVSLWSSDGFKSDGELCCQILYLIGFKPVWQADGQSLDVEPIPLDQLLFNGRSRPRIDVVVQTSSLVRDMLPNFIDLIDRAVTAAAQLDEPVERNYVKAHTDQRLAELAAESGEQSDHLFRRASYRVFSARPGAYTLGVGLMLDASAWNDRSELAETYIDQGGCALGANGTGGQAEQDQFAALLGRVEVTTMRQYSPEYNLTGCGCYASFLGGMTAAVETLSGRRTKLYWIDEPSAEQTQVNDFKDSLDASIRAQALNQAWLETMKREGFQGAAQVMNQVNSLFKWAASTEQVDDSLFDALAGKLIVDQANLNWLRRENPYALEEITRRLLEAQSRGLWTADEDLLARVQAAVMAIEGDMEESMGVVEGEFQGSQVDVITADQVDKWRPGWRLNRAGRSQE